MNAHTLTPEYRVFLQFSWSLWHLFLACEMPVSPAPVGQIEVEECSESLGGFNSRTQDTKAEILFFQCDKKNNNVHLTDVF